MQGKPLILIVDDEYDICELLKDEMDLCGFDSLFARNGEEALNTYLSHPEIDLILSDVRMPGSDGRSLLKMINEKQKIPPPFIFISGYADLTEPEALDLGATDLVIKPFNNDHLLSKVKNALTPRDEKFSVPPEGPNPQWIICWSEKDRLSSHGKVNLGRGGFFLQCDTKNFSKEDWIEFHIEFESQNQTHQLKGYGQIAWVRTDKIQGHFPMGVGIKFSYLDTQEQQNFFEYLRGKESTAYIPAK